MDPGPIDGNMGPKTMAALKEFQSDQKLTESGRLDDHTREKLGVIANGRGIGEVGQDHLSCRSLS
jgi:peptidoglycan hydrolase-like protein with peptidoglycan-binding domain